MNGSHSVLNIRSLFILLAIFAFVALRPGQLAAQEQCSSSGTCGSQIDDGIVEVTSVIAVSDDATEADGFAETDMDDYSWAEGYCPYSDDGFCWVAVEGDLYRNDTDIASDSEEDWVSVDTAELASSVTLGDTYDLVGTGGLCFDYYDEWGDVYSECDPLDATSAYFAAGAPYISSISQTSVAVGTNGQIVVNGDYLVDWFTGTTTPSITGSGIQLTFSSYNSSTGQVTLNYVAAQGAAVGDQSLTVATRFGTSNAVTLNVGDPTPVVATISNTTWNAGASNSFTISGSGFGNCPKITVSGPGVTSYSITGTTSDTNISASVTIAANSPWGTATVQVTSRGYACNGSSFVPDIPGAPAYSNSPTANIVPIPAPRPMVVFGAGPSACSSGADISQAPQNVFVGQVIALVGCLPNGSPAGLSISTSSWGTPTGTVVGGFDPSQTNNQQVMGLPAQNVQNFSFAWVGTGLQQATVTYSYILNNLEGNQATLNFNVYGPTTDRSDGAYFTATPGTVNVWPAGTASAGNSTNPWLEFGNGKNNFGMIFNVAAAPPDMSNGAFQWVQLLGQRTSQYRTTPPTSNSTNTGGLDNWYPYPTPPNNPTLTADSPGIELIVYGVSSFSEAADSFAAKMYLMWDPQIPSSAQVAAGQTTCSAASSIQDATGNTNSTKSNCYGSIPVPLGYISWGYCGDAVNTLTYQPSTQTNWMLNCGYSLPKPPSLPSFILSYEYPTWSNIITNSN
jgi:hypothetical protein